MTIALGFLCRNGIVLGADSQYTLGMSRTYGPKLFTHEMPGCSLAFAGAGDVDFMQMTVQQIKDVLGTKTMEIAEIKKEMERKVENVYKRHVYPYPSKPEEKPWFDLLIGLWGKNHGIELLKTARTGLLKVDTYECLGLGVYLGKFIADSVFHPQLSIEQAEFLAIQIIAEAKRYVEGCGGDSQILVLEKDSGKWLSLAKDQIRNVQYIPSKLSDFGRVLLFALTDPAIALYADSIFKKVVTEFALELTKDTSGQPTITDYNAEEFRQKVRDKIYTEVLERMREQFWNLIQEQIAKGSSPPSV